MTEEEKKKLIESRNEKVKQARDMIDKCDSEKRGLSAEERTKYDRILSDIELDDARMRQPDMVKYEPRSLDLSKNTGDGKGTVEEKRAQIYNALGRLIEARGKQMPEELRALSIGGAGAVLIPTDTLSSIIDLRIEMNFMRSLCRGYSFKNDTVIPVRTSFGKAQIIPEGGDYPKNDGALDKILMHAYKLGNIYLATEEMIADSVVNVLADFEYSAAQSIALAEMNLFINGDGDNKPQGLFVGGTNAGQVAKKDSVTYKELIHFDEILDPVYRDGAIYMCHPSMSEILRSVTDLQGRPLWIPDLTKGAPINAAQGDIPQSSANFFGKPIIVSNYVPEVEAGKPALCYANLKFGYGIADRQGFEIRVLEELYAGSGAIGIRYHERIDGKVLLPKAVQILSMGTN